MPGEAATFQCPKEEAFAVPQVIKQEAQFTARKHGATKASQQIPALKWREVEAHDVFDVRKSPFPEISKEYRLEHASKDFSRLFFSKPEEGDFCTYFIEKEQKYIIYEVMVITAGEMTSVKNLVSDFLVFLFWVHCRSLACLHGML